MFDYVTTWLFMFQTLTQSEDVLHHTTKCINNHLILNSMCSEEVHPPRLRISTCFTYMQYLLHF
jgi:hypothetical protein